MNKPILGNKVIEVKGNRQDNCFGVEAHLEADVLGRYKQTSEKGLGTKSYKKVNGAYNWMGECVRPKVREM